MFEAEFFATSAFKWVVLPLLIFSARVIDVSIGTIRIISVSRGRKVLSSLLGFFEVMIWLLAIGQIFNNLTNPLYYIAYGGGFATGNFIGIWIEEKLAMGVLVMRTITKKDASELIATMREQGYMATNVLADSTAGKVNIIYTLLKRSDLDEVIALIKDFHPHAIWSVSDAREASEAIPPFRTKRNIVSVFRPRIRKGK